MLAHMMCERYVIPAQAEAERELAPMTRWWRFAPSFNVGLAKQVPVVRVHNGESEGVLMRWGLVPAWAEGKPQEDKALHVDAREMESSLLFSGAWGQGQRCVLPFAGFYVWQLTPERHRQPFFVRCADRPVFGVAGLWDRSVADRDDVIESCSLITVPASSMMAAIDNLGRRMPAILQPNEYETWLNASAAEAKALLETRQSDGLVAHPVSPRINSMKYDDENLIKPVRPPH